MEVQYRTLIDEEAAYRERSSDEQKVMSRGRTRRAESIRDFKIGCPRSAVGYFTLKFVKTKRGGSWTSSCGQLKLGLACWLWLRNRVLFQQKRVIS